MNLSKRAFKAYLRILTIGQQTPSEQKDPVHVLCGHESHESARIQSLFYPCFIRVDSCNSWLIPFSNLADDSFVLQFSMLPEVDEQTECDLLEADEIGDVNGLQRPPFVSQFKLLWLSYLNRMSVMATP